MTETAWLADVVLPASAWPEKTGTVTNTDRLLQMGRRALNPPGDARRDRRCQLVLADIIPADERRDADCPFVPIAGRQPEHWQTGSMTRRKAVLDALKPLATASRHGADLARLGLAQGDVMAVASGRGAITLAVRRDDGMPTGCTLADARSTGRAAGHRPPGELAAVLGRQRARALTAVKLHRAAGADHRGWPGRSCRRRGHP